MERRTPRWRFYLDEDMELSVQRALQAYGHDAVTARDREARRARDAAHLLAAARDSRVFVTHNGTDFRLLQEAWRTWPISVRHSGILVIPQQRWTAEETAARIQEFVQSGVDPANELYHWRSGKWTRYEW